MSGPRLSKPVIGLLGGPGAGKSYVAKLFAEAGCGVVDADQLAGEVLKEAEVGRQLVRWWGAGVLTERGEVDRGAVGRIIFEEPAQKQRLEALIHPRVRQRRHTLHERFERDWRVRGIVEDTPLLMEQGLDGACDALVMVDAPREERLRRLEGSRGWKESELVRREKNQASLDIKRNHSDYLINNGGFVDSAEVQAQVQQVLAGILRAWARQSKTC